MATNKKNTKKVKSGFKVNLADVENGAEVYSAVVNAKIEANVDITPCEAVNASEYNVACVDAICQKTCDSLIEEMNKTCAECHKAKKVNIFKRFWNWITRKK